MRFPFGAVKDKYLAKLKGAFIRRNYDLVNCKRFWDDIKRNKSWYYNLHDIRINEVDNEHKVLQIELSCISVWNLIFTNYKLKTFYFFIPFSYCTYLSIEGNYGSGEKIKDSWFKE